jgi:hypothetical protein
MAIGSGVVAHFYSGWIHPRVRAATVAGAEGACGDSKCRASLPAGVGPSR